MQTNEKFMSARIRKSSIVDDHKSNGADSDLFHKMIQSLQKPLHLRTAREISLIIDATSTIEVLVKEGRPTHELLVKNMNYKFSPGKSYLFHKGDPADNFYIILQGYVSVLIPDPDNQDENAELREARILSSGDSFGELALLYNKPRTATIKCVTDCHFATLDKIAYRSLLKRKHEKDLKTRLEFVSTAKIFQGYNYSLLRRLFLNSEPVKKTRMNQYLYQEGQEPLCFYVVKKGEFKVVKNVDLACIGVENQDEAPSSGNLMRKRIKMKSIELALVNEGEIFGEEDLFLKRPRFTSVVCNSSEGVVLEIRKVDFESIIMRDESSREWLEQMTMFKDKHYKEKVEAAMKGSEQTKPVETEEKMRPQSSRARILRPSSSKPIPSKKMLVDLDNNYIVKTAKNMKARLRVLSAKKETKQKAEVEFSLGKLITSLYGKVVEGSILQRKKDELDFSIISPVPPERLIKFEEPEKLIKTDEPENQSLIKPNLSITSRLMSPIIESPTKTMIPFSFRTEKVIHTPGAKGKICKSTRNYFQFRLDTSSARIDDVGSPRSKTFVTIAQPLVSSRAFEDINSLLTESITPTIPTMPGTNETGISPNYRPKIKRPNSYSRYNNMVNN
eukprot:TRINITY_DN9015_c0_g1_i1.p1 TRINITY_DN9015_c0_g1~~TRINITY_DN9015_c0_g1_i1.p1  ORF type:complete len:617 (+),score=78.01 TRINITY_DN9015_c0_g1_i1:73-1923(+)